jgi:hypothetical protein
MASGSGSQGRRLISLPPIDGDFEVGIAAGVDPTLVEADKLPVHGTTAEELYSSSVAWALGREFEDERVNSLFVAGVAAIVGCGLIRKRNNIADGDWYEADSATPLSEPQILKLGSLINKETLGSALTIVCATKVNYWLMNHHVGQTTERNTALGYVNKVLQLKYP